MKSFSGIVVSLLIIGLFAVSLISAGIILMVQNDKADSLIDDPLISNYYRNINQTLSSYEGTTDAAYNAFSNSSITTTSGIPFINSMGAIWKTIKNTPVIIYDFSIGGLIGKAILNDGQKGIVTGVLGAIILLTIIFGVWRLIATGAEKDD